MDERAAELGMIDRLPKATVGEMSVLNQVLGCTHSGPGEAALLRCMIDLLGRQAGYEIRHHLVDDVRRARLDHLRILVFRIVEICGHAIGTEEGGQLLHVPRIEPTRDERVHVTAAFGAELRAWRRARCMMT